MLIHGLVRALHILVTNELKQYYYIENVAIY